MASNQEIGSAYLLVKPKMDGSAENELKNAGGRAGGSFGGAFQVAMGNIMSNVAEQAVSFIGGALKDAFSSYADYEQLVGGVEKIFNDMDTSRIFADAQNAYKELNMSANDYMSTINQVGAAFSANMGDEAAYEAARTGMLAISDYASGTGLDIDELSEKFRIISKSTQSYQSVCDQFSGILPQSSQAFLEQAQAAGLLSDEYTSLSEVPIDEYQQALVGMLEQGTESLGLTGNTLRESTETISGSLAMLKSAWADFLVGIFDENADMDALVGKLVESLQAAFNNVMPALEQAAISLFSVIPDAFMQVLDDYFPGASEAIGRIADAFQPAIASMQRIADEIGPMIMPMLERVAELAGDMLVPALERLGGAVSDLMVAIEPYMPLLVTIAEFLADAFIAALSGVIDKISLLIEMVSLNIEIFTSFLETLGISKEDISDFASTAGEKFRGFRSNVSQAIDAAKQKISDWAGNVLNNAKSNVSNFASNVESAFGSIRDGISDAMSTAESIVSGAISGITSAFDNAVSTIQSAMDTAVSVVYNAVDSISNAFSNISISFPHIPLPHIEWHMEDVAGLLSIPQFDGISWYATGGFVDDATLIGAGERGGEFIWPSYEPYLGRYADAIASRIDFGDEISELRRDIRDVRLVLSIDGRAFAEATVGEMDRAFGSMSRRAVAR